MELRSFSSDEDSSGESSQARHPPIYLVQSPPEEEQHVKKTKWSFGSNPSSAGGSPPGYHHCAPFHLSRGSSAKTWFSTSTENSRNVPYRNRVPTEFELIPEEEEWEETQFKDRARLYVVWFLVYFFAVLGLISLILHGVSSHYQPEIAMKEIVFEKFHFSIGADSHSYTTMVLTIKSKTKMFYRNHAKFFSVHVSATPIELYYYDFKLASGKVSNFYVSKKEETVIRTKVSATKCPVYGAILPSNVTKPKIPLNMTFVVKSKANILGKMVKRTFYRNIHCSLTFQGQLRKPHNLTNSCHYN